MDSIDVAKYFLSLVLVLSLMAGVWLVLKKAGMGGAPFLKSAPRRRLSVVEILTLDPKRKAVILRCDDQEHLVILGQTSETVVGSKMIQSGSIDLSSTDTSPTIEEI